jgi:hypothetical protein
LHTNEIIAGIVLLIGMTLLILAGTRFHKMIEEVNIGKNQRDKESYVGVDIFKFLRIVKQHELGYPQSRLRWQYGLFLCLGFTLAIAALVLVLF